MLKSPLRALLVFLIAALCHAVVWNDGSIPFVNAAFADDDDGGGDGGGGGDHDSDSDSDNDSDDGDDDHDSDDDDDDDDAIRTRGKNRNGAGKGRRDGGSQIRARRAAPVAQIVNAPSQIVAYGLSPADLANLQAQGFSVIKSQPVAATGSTMHLLGVPKGTSMPAARTIVRSLPSGQNADFNAFYRTNQQVDPDPCVGEYCAERVQVQWPVSPDSCAPDIASVTVGMIDTGINAKHAAFSDARLDVVSLTDSEQPASRAVHGTAVASLLVGNPESRAPGLVPKVQLIAVDVFNRVGGDERAAVFPLVEGLTRLADEGAQIINLSLAGPDNSVLEKIVTELTQERGIVLVASAGNAGPSAKPLFPAAYDPVIAVTAVDRHDNIYRHAVRGPQIDLAAPGVDVWAAASVAGARWKTGTSFAAPFVSAAAAIIVSQHPDLSPADVRDILIKGALDLGPEGRDDTFGFGLVSFQGLCAGQDGATDLADSALE